MSLIPGPRAFATLGLSLAFGVTSALIADEPPVDDRQHVRHADAEKSDANLPFLEREPWVDGDETGGIRLTSLQPQPTPLQTESITSPTASSPAAAQSLTSQLFGSGQESSLLDASRRRLAQTPSTNVVFGNEAKGRATSDVGNLLFKSNEGIGIGSQRRTPIITDTRVRGKGLGRLNAAGSYWVPARDDLDTILSKIDSRIIDDVIVLRGPYSVFYGPGLSFIDFELLESPRYYNGPESHGSSSLQYQTQGEAWYGRQVLEGGDDSAGYRVGYGHRTANDYTAGDGTSIPSSYKSRNVDVVLGRDLTPNSRIEFTYLRLDQTDMELPGAFFDLDLLVTDGYEVSYIVENQDLFDRFRVDGWWNQTRFYGPSNSTAFPTLSALGITDDMTNGRQSSAGYTAAMTWGEDDDLQLTAGNDLRFVKQYINERATFTQPEFMLTLTDVWGGVPPSHSANPGLFLDLKSPAYDRLRLHTGARVDFYSVNIDGIPSGNTFSIPQTPVSLDTIATLLGTSDFDRTLDPLWAAFVTSEYDVNDNITLNAGAGHSMRAPTLTELYAVGPFLSILQNGLTAVVGSPTILPSRMWQVDVGMTADYGDVRGGASGFYSWVNDFITLEHISSLPPENDQRTYLFVNTPLATLTGVELYGEADLTDYLIGFGTLSYVRATDRSRSAGGQHELNLFTGVIEYDPNLPRGISGGSDHEPLPGIPPLETRLGLRLHDPTNNRWVVEFTARVVDNQGRAATSLYEQPTAGFATYDIRSVMQATDNLSVVCGVENLANKFYREHLDLRQGLGVYQPGRNFYFGAELVY